MSRSLGALLVIATLSAGCTGLLGSNASLACGPSIVISFTPAQLDAALARAGAKERVPEAGLPFRAPDLDAKWRGYELRSLAWDAGLNEEGMREREAENAGLRQVEPGGAEIWISIGMGARRSEAEIRAHFEAFARNVTTADAATLDRIFADLLRSKSPGVIMGDNEVIAYTYSAKAEVPLRLSAFDAELRALAEPSDQHSGFGHASRTYFRYGMLFDVPTRELTERVGNMTVLFQTDGAGWASATVGPTSDVAVGVQAVRDALAARGLGDVSVDPARATSRPPVHCD